MNTEKQSFKEKLLDKKKPVLSARSELEAIADRIEELARSSANWATDPMAKQAFAIAWDLKQLARTGTASKGI